MTSRGALAVLGLVLVALVGCSAVVDGTGRVATGSPGPTRSGSAPGALPDFTHGVTIGTGRVRVVDYDDLLCPPCATLQPGLTKVLTRELARNAVRVTFVDLHFLDSVGSGYSTRAAAAALCAAQQDPKRYLAYKDVLFAQQPAEGSAGLSPDQLVDAGRRAGLTSAGFAACVRTQAFAKQVQLAGAAAQRAGISSVPNIFVAGRPVRNPTADTVQQAIDAAR